VPPDVGLKATAPALIAVGSSAAVLALTFIRNASDQSPRILPVAGIIVGRKARMSNLPAIRPLQPASGAGPPGRVETAVSAARG
jgi:hypothetical protein